MKVVYAKTIQEFDTAWQSLKHHYRDESYLLIFQYLMKTWLKHKEMFIKAWTNSQLILTTQRVSKLKVLTIQSNSTF